MNELSIKVIKSIKHGFNKDHESIITIETENELFHYRIDGLNRALTFIEKTGIRTIPNGFKLIGDF
jgi:hypothetical protein